MVLLRERDMYVVGVADTWWGFESEFRRASCWLSGSSKTSWFGRVAPFSTECSSQCWLVGFILGITMLCCEDSFRKNWFRTSTLEAMIFCATSKCPRRGSFPLWNQKAQTKWRKCCVDRFWQQGFHLERRNVRSAGRARFSRHPAKCLLELWWIKNCHNLQRQNVANNWPTVGYGCARKYSRNSVCLAVWCPFFSTHQKQNTYGERHVASAKVLRISLGSNFLYVYGRTGVNHYDGPSLSVRQMIVCLTTIQRFYLPQNCDRFALVDDCRKRKLTRVQNHNRLCIWGMDKCSRRVSHAWVNDSMHCGLLWVFSLFQIDNDCGWASLALEVANFLINKHATHTMLQLASSVESFILLCQKGPFLSPFDLIWPVIYRNSKMSSRKKSTQVTESFSPFTMVTQTWCICVERFVVFVLRNVNSLERCWRQFSCNVYREIVFAGRL